MATTDAADARGRCAQCGVVDASMNNHLAQGQHGSVAQLWPCCGLVQCLDSMVQAAPFAASEMDRNGPAQCPRPRRSRSHRLQLLRLQTNLKTEQVGEVAETQAGQGGQSRVLCRGQGDWETRVATKGTSSKCRRDTSLAKALLKLKASLFVFCNTFLLRPLNPLTLSHDSPGLQMPLLILVNHAE